MAAIRRTKPPTKTSIGPKSHQPPRFRATGRGYFNKLPRFPADAKIANGVLVNNAVTDKSDHYRIWLFVDAVQTGWQLSGETSQTQTSRSFYPRNMVQDDLVIEGAVANQYEFDRIAEFIDAHHLSQFNPAWSVVESLDQNNQNYPGLTFKLFRPQVGKTLDQHPPMHYGMVATGFAAGHQRFMNFPTWTMTCKVIHDHLQSNAQLDQAIAYWTKLKTVYGDVLPPVLGNGGKK